MELVSPTNGLQRGEQRVLAPVTGTEDLTRTQLQKRIYLSKVTRVG